ncbi:hypothetical protein CAEBREN_25480 [Caenorhabditis brenneri]|uniref:Uncharacterized protein n=1 Tax=Caenorhabditis brenneri TaxID=135651 RepID=G0P467_CAEBE|nr:hypothetical protein CAEBREN_25480 [Caenorhabditis brenneri]
MSKTPEELNAAASKDRDLIRFIIAESKKYDRWEIFLRAQEQVESLKQENVLDLYLRYHRVLYPLITGQSSDEWNNQYRSNKNQEEGKKGGVEPRKIRASSSSSDQEESCLWIIMDEPNCEKIGKPVDVLGQVLKY